MNFIRTSIIVCIFYILHSTSFAQWSTVGNVVANTIGTFHHWNNKLYMTGPYIINGDTMNGICSYDEISFDSLGSGFGAGGASSLAVYNNELYAGGSQQLGSWPYIPCSSNIDKWDGTNWSCVGAGGPGGTEVINTMAVYKGELYVGGTFFSMGGVSAKKIARWDGTQWKDVAGGFIGNCTVQTMAVYNGELYVGGNIGLPNGPNNYYYNLVRWNGTTWDSVGGKFGGGWIKSLCIDSVNNVLYAGGGITFAGTIPVWSVAQWDGSNLSAPGIGITNGANAMAMYQGKLIVGGSAFSDTTLASWDGTYWCPFSQMPNGTITALEEYQGKLYVGGLFTQIDTITTDHIAIWSGNLCPNSGLNEIAGQIKFKVFPNPAKNNIIIETEENKIFVVHIINPLSQQVIKKSFHKKTEVDVSGYGKGLFLVEVCDEKGVKCHTEKVLIE